MDQPNLYRSIKQTSRQVFQLPPVVETASKRIKTKFKKIKIINKFLWVFFLKKITLSLPIKLIKAFEGEYFYVVDLIYSVKHFREDFDLKMTKSGSHTHTQNVLNAA